MVCSVNLTLFSHMERKFTLALPGYATMASEHCWPDTDTGHCALTLVEQRGSKTCGEAKGFLVLMRCVSLILCSGIFQM